MHRFLRSPELGRRTLRWLQRYRDHANAHTHKYQSRYGDLRNRLLRRGSRLRSVRLEITQCGSCVMLPSVCALYVGEPVHCGTCNNLYYAVVDCGWFVILTRTHRWPPPCCAVFWQRTNVHSDCGIASLWSRIFMVDMVVGSKTWLDSLLTLICCTSSNVCDVSISIWPFMVHRLFRGMHSFVSGKFR